MGTVTYGAAVTPHSEASHPIAGTLPARRGRKEGSREYSIAECTVNGHLEDVGDDDIAPLQLGRRGRRGQGRDQKEGFFSPAR